MKSKLCAFLLLFLLVASIFATGVSAQEYPAYNYMANGEITVVPQPFKIETTFYGSDFGVATLSGAEDICCGADGTIYIADTERNQIVVRKADGSNYIIKNYSLNGETFEFNKPQGVFFTGNSLYICDQGNNKIVIMELDTGKVRVVGRPESRILDDDFIFLPKRVTVDKYERMYCVADGQYNGLMVFEKDDTFSGFIGANKVSITISQIIWRALSTKAQKERQSIFIPTEFSSVAIDKDNFVYTTTSTVDQYNPEESEPVRRQSPNGDNIIRIANGNYPIGDENYLFGGDTFSGPSRFCDIAVWNNLMYSVLDETRNRIFTYDHNGSLLFVYGGYGESDGYFSRPRAIEHCNEKLYVLDSKAGSISVLVPTQYTKNLILATDYTAEGDYASALSAWTKVLEYNCNNELAYQNVSRILLNKGEYSGALEYAKKANNQAIYSQAFTQLRSNFISKNVGMIIVAIFALSILSYLLKWVNKRFEISNRLKAVSPTYASLSFAKYIYYAPLDGFWVQKREKKGNVASGVVIIALLFLSFVAAEMFTGFCFLSPTDELKEFNLLLQFAKAVLPIMLWCIANWCITALMDGNGNFKEIFISTCFAVTPFVIANFIKIILSNVLTANEAQIMAIVMGIGIAYTVVLIVASTCSVHDCSFGKAILTIFLTLIGMAIIVFISVLFFNLINKFFDFAISVYNELKMRV